MKILPFSRDEDVWTCRTSLRGFGVDVAWTRLGVCAVAPVGSGQVARQFPYAKPGELPWEVGDTEILHLRGTEFQLAVWRALLEIPSGETATYGQIARRIGHPKAFRAVGSAVGANPVCILVPCHRVVPCAYPRALGGYRWGAEMKLRLLEEEKKTRG